MLLIITPASLTCTLITSTIWQSLQRHLFFKILVVLLHVNFLSRTSADNEGFKLVILIKITRWISVEIITCTGSFGESVWFFFGFFRFGFFLCFFFVIIMEVKRAPQPNTPPSPFTTEMTPNSSLPEVNFQFTQHTSSTFGHGGSPECSPSPIVVKPKKIFYVSLTGANIDRKLKPRYYVAGATFLTRVRDERV